MVIVTCCRDMWGFEILCRSISKLVKPCKIIIVINEEDMYCDAWLFWYEKYISAFLAPHSPTVYKRSEIYKFDVPYEHIRDGWVQQQVLKLFAAEYVDTNQYVCIDSKNFFFRKTDIDQIKQTEQRVDWLHPWLIEWCKHVCSILEVEFTGRSNFALTQNITPFVMTTKYVRDMIRHFGTKKQFFDKFFILKLPNTTCSPSEFIFYDIWCKKKNYPLDNFTIQNSATIWEHTLDEDIDLYKYLSESHQYFGITVTGFHKGIKGRFSLNQCVSLLHKLNCKEFMPKSVNYPF